MLDSKKSAVLFSLIIAGLVCWPVTENLKSKPTDNFPLSYYPMFSFERGTGYTLSYVVGYNTECKRYYIPYKLIGSGGFNQVRRQLRKMVKEDKCDQVLNRVVKRIRKQNEAPYNQLMKLELVTGRFNFNSYFIEKNKQPENEKVLAVKIMEAK